MSPTKVSTPDNSKNKHLIGGQDTSSNQTSAAIAEELSRSDLGQLINEYKNVVIVVVVLFIVGAISYVGWKSLRASQHESARLEMMNFKKDILVPVQEQKKTLSDLYQGYQKMVSKATSGATLMEITPEVVSLLSGSETTSGDWASTFQAAQKLCDKKDYCYLHFGLVLTNYFEEHGKLEQALESATALIGNPYVVEDKLYFDLVRLAQAANKLDKKSEYLEFLKKNHLSSNYKVLAEQI